MRKTKVILSTFVIFLWLNNLIILVFLARLSRLEYIDAYAALFLVFLITSRVSHEVIGCLKIKEIEVVMLRFYEFNIMEK